MKIAAAIGWILLLVAFVAAAAESAVQGLSGRFGLVSALNLLQTLLPAQMTVVEAIVIAKIHPAVWDPVLVTVLKLPAWALTGIPGVVLAWVFRPKAELGPGVEDEDIPHTSYEDVVAAAEEIGLGDDVLPSKYVDHADYDPARPHEIEGGDDFAAGEAGAEGDDLAARIERIKLLK